MNNAYRITLLCSNGQAHQLAEFPGFDEAQAFLEDAVMRGFSYMLEFPR